MNIRHIPFLNEQDPDTGYDMSADAPTTCPNGEDLPCDCRNFWVVRARKDTDFTPYAYSALRCDAHGKQPISDCKRYSDSLRDVLIAAGFRYRGFWWQLGDEPDCCPGESAHIFCRYVDYGKFESAFPDHFERRLAGMLAGHGLVE